MEIKEMTFLDYEEIKSKLVEEFDDFWSASILKSELESENSKSIVIKRNNEILGFASIWISPVDVQITNIVVKKSNRKKGIGSLLLGKLIEIARETKRSNITLEVNETNTEAIKLYEKYDFERLGIRKKYYNQKDNAIIMTKYFK